VEVVVEVQKGVLGVEVLVEVLVVLENLLELLQVVIQQVL
jgi:hypothetical protein